ncbi:class I SAM-dependent methyltransferase [Bradyrhizobium sp. LTSPM299]|uniref:class I SAM-dependent methyltransferase n=1 Tax=Bradyrhizobium sp. LTSPM299 TaxID=1619233 RepID=UPI0009E32B6F|nr:class I SAM-dependent methyltransferase [Bradyrhizobium sp. LTSPM299]
MNRETLADAAKSGEVTLPVLPPHVEILSPAEAINFPSEWYDIMDEHHFWMIWRTRAFLQQCRTLSISMETPLTVLEIGCGQGILRTMLEATTRWTIDAVDLNVAALAHSAPGRGRTALYNIHDRAADLAARYDALILFDVIEHIDRPTEFLASALHHLKPGGHVFINVPALQSLYSKFDVAVGHCRRYTKTTLEAELTGAGVRKVDDRYWGLTMLPVLTLRKLLVSLGRENDGRSTTMVQRGVQPPNRLANAVLTGAMQFETHAVPNPPLGTSLLYVGQAG